VTGIGAEKPPIKGVWLMPATRIEYEKRYFAAFGSRGSTICVCVMSAASFPSER